MNNVFRTIGSILLTFVLFFHTAAPVRAETTVPVYLFYGRGCPHCAKEQKFLQLLDIKYPQLDIKEYEVYYNQKNNGLLQNVAKQLDAEVGGVPFLVIGETYFIGFAEGITTQEIENKILECSKKICNDPVASIITGTETPAPNPTTEQSNTEGKKIHMPIFGSIDTSTVSLPVLTFVLAFLDGFNPCAMWTLLFLISLLLGMKDRKRMWILGVAFIISSAAVYFLFLSAWLNLFLFLGFITWIRMLVGFIALGAGTYHVRDYIINKQGGCSVTGDEKRKHVFHSLRTLANKRQLFLALGGIILLAVAVNMVELVCSAGLPAIYTQVLTLSKLPLWQYYLYLLFYIVIFMADDLFVFFAAMMTLRAVGIESKYSRYSHLIGGLLMAIIGLLLLVKPEWLMFG